MLTIKNDIMLKLVLYHFQGIWFKYSNEREREREFLVFWKCGRSSQTTRPQVSAWPFNYMGSLNVLGLYFFKL